LGIEFFLRLPELGKDYFPYISGFSQIEPFFWGLRVFGRAIFGGICGIGRGKRKIRRATFEKSWRTFEKIFEKFKKMVDFCLVM